MSCDYHLLYQINVPEVREIDRFIHELLIQKDFYVVSLPLVGVDRIFKLFVALQRNHQIQRLRSFEHVLILRAVKHELADGNFVRLFYIDKRALLLKVSPLLFFFERLCVPVDRAKMLSFALDNLHSCFKLIVGDNLHRLEVIFASSIIVVMHSTQILPVLGQVSRIVLRVVNHVVFIETFLLLLVRMGSCSVICSGKDVIVFLIQSWVKILLLLDLRQSDEFSVYKPGLDLRTTLLSSVINRIPLVRGRFVVGVHVFPQAL